MPASLPAIAGVKVVRAHAPSCRSENPARLARGMLGDVCRPRVSRRGEHLRMALTRWLRLAWRACLVQPSAQRDGVRGGAHAAGDAQRRCGQQEGPPPIGGARGRRLDRGFRSSPIGMPSRPVRAGHRVVRLRLRPKPGHRHRAPAYVRTRPAGCTPASPAPASATAACPATTSTSAPKAATFSLHRPRSALSPTGSSSGSAATAAWTGPQSPGSQRHQQEPERRSTQAAT